MKIATLATTNDIELLRTLALAMVREGASALNANLLVLAEKEHVLKEKDNRIRLLEEALMLARQQHFGRKCEALSGLQRSLFEEDTDADIAATETQLESLLPKSPSD